MYSLTSVREEEIPKYALMTFMFDIHQMYNDIFLVRDKN